MTNCLRIATWNINSVRARIDQLKHFLSEFQPDVCCLQEIKCQTEQFPHKALKGMGYDHHAIHGQKAYHGVAILSRLPVVRDHRTDYCQMGDARHVAAEVEAGGKPVLIHNYYVPAGGDEPDPARNPIMMLLIFTTKHIPDQSIHATFHSRHRIGKGRAAL